MLTWHRYKHVPGVIHIRRDDLLLKHRPWHTMLRSSVTDHGMRKYSMGIYKHMPGGLEAHVSFFAVRPVARLCDKVAQAAQRAAGMGGEEEQDDAHGESCQCAWSHALKWCRSLKAVMYYSACCSARLVCYSSVHKCMSPVLRVIVNTCLCSGCARTSRPVQFISHHCHYSA
jgi:hypothetical protein